MPTKISAGESFIVAINSGIEKSLEERGGGVSRFSVENFCLKVPTKISVGECFIVALISVTEKVWRRGGVSKISVKIFLCHSAENFRRGILQCCINFWRRGGGYQKFTSKCFCLTMPTKFSVVESFIVALILGIEKVWRRGGGYQDFRSKIFASKCRRKFP